MRYTLFFTNIFKKDYKLAQKRNYDLSKLDHVVQTLQAGEPLDPKIIHYLS